MVGQPDDELAAARLREHILSAVAVLFLFRVVASASEASDILELFNMFRVDAIILFAVLYVFVAERRPVRALHSAAALAAWSIMHFMPTIQNLSRTFPKFPKHYLAFGGSLSDLFVCTLLLVSTSYNILSRRVDSLQRESPGMPKNEPRKPSALEVSAMFGLMVILLAALGILLHGATGLSSLQLWISILCVLLLAAFAIPFFLIVLGVIRRGTGRSRSGWCWSASPS